MRNMRMGDADFRDTRHVEYTEIIDSGAFSEAEFSGIGTQTCLKAEKDS
jgi:hypothetical protein